MIASPGTLEPIRRTIDAAGATSTVILINPDRYFAERLAEEQEERKKEALAKRARNWERFPEIKALSYKELSTYHKGKPYLQTRGRI